VSRCLIYRSMKGSFSQTRRYGSSVAAIGPQ
jgi:hypothetical protein